MAALFAAGSPLHIYYWPIIAAGVLLWETPGLGKYWAFRNYNAAEKEIGWIDWLGDKLVKNTELRCLFQMSLRGLYLAPLLIALGFLGHPTAFWLIPACLLQGPAYWIWQNTGDKIVGYGELTMGLIVGLILTAAAA